MKWETYKLLSEEDRKEWEFKYSNIRTPNIEISILIVFWLLYVVAGAISLVLLKEYVDVGFTALEFMNNISHITEVILIAWTIVKVIEFIYYIIMKHKENKWIKERIK